MWEDYTLAALELFGRTDTARTPWWFVNNNNKRVGRLHVIQHVLTLLPYDDKNTDVVDRRRAGDRRARARAAPTIAPELERQPLRVDASRRDQHRGAPLIGHDVVELVPVVVRPARSGEDRAEQETDTFVVDTGGAVVGADQLGVPFHRRPLPARPGDRGELRTGAEVRELASSAARDERDHFRAGNGVREHAGVHE